MNTESGEGMDMATRMEQIVPRTKGSGPARTRNQLLKPGVARASRLSVGEPDRASGAEVDDRHPVWWHLSQADEG